jgi:hypothetical protein
MSALETFNHIANALGGQRLSHVWRGYGSAIFLEFGNLTARMRPDGSQGNPKGQFTLRIEWSWRIEDATSIICGAWSEEPLWEPALDRLRNTSVAAIGLFGRIPEIYLKLTNGLHVVSFMTAQGQPEWSISDSRSTPGVSVSVKDGALSVERPDVSLH